LPRRAPTHGTLSMNSGESEWNRCSLDLFATRTLGAENTGSPKDEGRVEFSPLITLATVYLRDKAN
jgi:hypothetical protein